MPTAPKRASTKTIASERRSPFKVKVGDEFTEKDIKLSSFAEVDTAKSNTVYLLVAALVIFYGAYMIHEWMTNKSFDAIGQFLQDCISGFIGWAIGKSQRRAGPS